MNSLAVKAAQERAKYIQDKYLYGITCNSCKYEFKKFALDDFISQCFSICIEDVETITNDSTIDCTLRNPTEVIPIDCIPAVEIVDCNQLYKTMYTQSFENVSFIYNEVMIAGEEIRLEFTSAVVNGVNYLNSSKFLDINAENIKTENVGDFIYTKNIVEFLNNLNLPQLYFDVGKDRRTMLVRFPVNYTWQIETTANDDIGPVTHGVKINQDGIVEFQLIKAFGYSSPPFSGSVDINFNTDTEILSIDNLC
jgi:hypothetical protein